MLENTGKSTRPKISTASRTLGEHTAKRTPANRPDTQLLPTDSIPQRAPITRKLARIAATRAANSKARKSQANPTNVRRDNASRVGVVAAVSAAVDHSTGGTQAERITLRNQRIPARQSLSTRRLVTPKSNVGGSLARRLVGDGGKWREPDRCLLLGVRLSVGTHQVPDHALIASISLPGFPLEEFQG